ncbi:MAG: type II restriction endonuclease [Acidobacteriota bacterium]
MKKEIFLQELRAFVKGLDEYVSTKDNQWTVKGFIDVFKNIYTISADTKIVSKILEIHLLPKLLEFAQGQGFKIVLPDHQNYYPDISFVYAADESIKYALDFKTTYRLSDYPNHCNGFTLGSHGEYFINRSSRKNIQFPYKEYSGHFVLGAIYTRTAPEQLSETQVAGLNQLRSITSVIKDIQFFANEKWKIASDQRGSGNTANIGSISSIEDLLTGNGMFSQLGEQWFDDYWMNYGKITTIDETGKEKKIKTLAEFAQFRGGEVKLIVTRTRKTKVSKNRNA